MSQQSCSSMLQSMGNTHIWMCGGALTVFMMGEFGLEKGPRQLFKWGFRLTSSCHKCRCLDASAAAKNCVRGEAVSRRGPVPGYLVLLEVVRAVLPADAPSLSRQVWQPHVGLRPWILQQRCVRGAGCLQFSAGWPLARSDFFSYHCKKEHRIAPLFNWGGPSCSKSSANTVTIQNRNTSRLQ